MRQTFTSRRIGGRHGRFVRAVTGLCLLLFVGGFFSMAQGSVTPHGTKPHCPQGQAHSGQHSQSHCLWHCDGIDAQASAGRGGGSPAMPTRFVTGARSPIPLVAWFHLGCIPRGPPASLHNVTVG
jgi:hypothetical protein